MRNKLYRLSLSVIVTAWLSYCTRAFSSSVVKSGIRQAPQNDFESNSTQQSNTDQYHVERTDDVEIIFRLTQEAIYNRGQDIGFKALIELSTMCKRRLPFEFSSPKRSENKGSLISFYPKLIPQNATSAFLDQVKLMENKGWISTNEDSVDGLPSLHANLISNGKPIYSEDPSDFQVSLQTLFHIVKPYIYNELLSDVRRKLNSTSLEVSDVFFRRYGKSICGNFTRNSISSHYDVLSRATAVIALDSTASDGKNGLFTTHLSPSGETSNHAGLRRFFPLDVGDGVLHTWDVLHGVDVEPGLDRTSLIVWFVDHDKESTEEGDTNNKIQSVAPWLQRQKSDDVAQFVMAGALASTEGLKEKDAETLQHRLYLNSAFQGNAFSLTRMGSLLEEDALSDTLKEVALRALNKLRPLSDLPTPIQNIQDCFPDNDNMVMAMRFWFEGAIRGTPGAQKALADELMYQASQVDYHEDTYLLAATFFALAAQQGDDEASKSLYRLIDYDCENRQVHSEEEFLASPVVQVARIATTGKI